jgi:acetyl-CoA carboxylase biotin carboxyl carrier protein
VSESVDPRSRSELRALLRAIEEGGWEYARVEIDGATLVVSHDPGFAALEQRREPSTQPAEASAVAAAVEQPAPLTEVPGPPATANGSVADPPAGPLGGSTGEVQTVTAPSIGLFWRSPKPGAPPFVEVGDRVQADDTVCIIEVMKLMTHVPAGVTGVVRTIHVSNGDMVEHGMPLVDVEPEVLS